MGHLHSQSLSQANYKRMTLISKVSQFEIVPVPEMRGEVLLARQFYPHCSLTVLCELNAYIKKWISICDVDVVLHMIASYQRITVPSAALKRSCQCLFVQCDVKL